MNISFGIYTERNQYHCYQVLMDDIFVFIHEFRNIETQNINNYILNTLGKPHFP